ncbi:hypothetical protein [Moraxella nasicaprae]|uniref:YcxB-like protein domain-containing protein n=1 Tax=Moraxella nasicaprae TaxID=2904122 RepID=A0ABY6F4N4_9GAMM|nr:hypothetical protein [Moraxella nasicaprae]UXZ05064.1 hypothetical protein LU297_01005 [Moraxella nasicaprae]
MDIAKIIGDDIWANELLTDDDIANLTLPIGKQHSKFFVIISTIAVILLMIITVFCLLLLLSDTRLWDLILFTALLSFTILMFYQHKNNLKDVLIDDEKITVIKRSPFNLNHHRIQLIYFKDIYHSYIEAVQVGRGNYCYYLVVIEYLIYGDDKVFYKKKQFTVQDFGTNQDKANDFLILLKSLLEYYHKHNGTKAHLPTIEFIPQR